ncbi:MAG: hypothetical protein LBD27_02690 [Tannerella sp.]|jgi:hypothetical protein|nr:hypothetical protein [Tannerella sp.]
MDNQIGDWLYYIVILTVVGISLVSSLNKKKKRPEILSEPELLDEMMPPSPPVRMQRKTPPPVRKSRLSDRLDMAQEGIRTLTPESPAVPDEPEIAWADSLELTDTDGLRKAVIHAEIFNRKY